jgi:hypothetical protein
MNRKDYQKPTIKVVQLRPRQQMLLQTSDTPVSATMNSTWDEEDI